MDSFGKETYLGYTTIPKEQEPAYNLGMDEHFVAVAQCGPVSRIDIVSIKTRTIVETIADSFVKYVLYEHGLLFIKYSSFVR